MTQPLKVGQGSHATLIVLMSLVALVGLLLVPCGLGIFALLKTSEFFGEDYGAAIALIDRAFMVQVISTILILVSTAISFIFRFRFWTGLALSIGAIAIIGLSTVIRSVVLSMWPT